MATNYDGSLLRLSRSFFTSFTFLVFLLNFMVRNTCVIICVPPPLYVNLTTTQNYSLSNSSHGTAFLCFYVLLLYCLYVLLVFFPVESKGNAGLINKLHVLLGFFPDLWLSYETRIVHSNENPMGRIVQCWVLHTLQPNIFCFASPF